jgi:hypothetical protein
MKSVFFYGLFMDADLLRSKGLKPSSPRLAYATGYGLRIGARATLEKSPGERAYGSVIALEERELAVLYGDASVADYLPETLLATDTQGHSIDAISYILPMDKLSGRNPEYAKSLSAAARKIGLPGAYVEEIETWI